MGVYRGNVEVVRDILKAAKEERIQSKIMHDANVNQSQFKGYAAALVELGYLEKKEISGDVCYRPTVKGLEVLGILGKASKIMKEIKEHIK